MIWSVKANLQARPMPYVLAFCNATLWYCRLDNMRLISYSFVNATPRRVRYWKCVTWDRQCPCRWHRQQIFVRMFQSKYCSYVCVVCVCVCREIVSFAKLRTLDCSLSLSLSLFTDTPFTITANWWKKSLTLLPVGLKTR